jgi:hypothetical protein
MLKIHLILGLLFMVKYSYAWSGYCYEYDINHYPKPVSTSTKACCNKISGSYTTNDFSHCWNFPASKKTSFTSCCTSYGDNTNLY